jgi:hypothetical protein
MPWRRPIVPRPLGRSIVGAGALHGRVRDGNGWDRPAPATRTRVKEHLRALRSRRGTPRGGSAGRRRRRTPQFCRQGGRRLAPLWGGAGVKKRESPRPLGRPGCAPRGACTCRLANRSSRGGLTRSRPRGRGGGTTHLGGRFALRCRQRLSRPDVATRRCPWRDSRRTSGRSSPVLSYWGTGPAVVQRPWRIETELSHDVLNPARVPL